MDDFWKLLDDVEPRLSSWPVGDLVRLVDSVEDAKLESPILAVERAMGQPLTVEERGLVMLKVLAPANLGTPPEPLRVAFTRVAEMAEPWAAAVSVGALGRWTDPIGQYLRACDVSCGPVKNGA